MRLNTTVAVMFSVCIFECGFLSDTSYEDDVANDRSILSEIIKANPILDSAVKAGRYFLPTDAEYGHITGHLDLSGLGLNDSNFHFPKSVGNFRLVNVLGLADNRFIELPSGTRDKNWKRIDVWKNKICNPSSETITYLDEKTKGSLGGYWRDSQRCNDSIPGVIP